MHGAHPCPAMPDNRGASCGAERRKRNIFRNEGIMTADTIKAGAGIRPRIRESLATKQHLGEQAPIYYSLDHPKPFLADAVTSPPLHKSQFLINGLCLPGGLVALSFRVGTSCKLVNVPCNSIHAFPSSFLHSKRPRKSAFLVWRTGIGTSQCKLHK
ncbi:hypothetical protein LZ31DRAFT_293443 [Colletotrichum somersetense]|nr:hypothetical protein LZ31DRAFT_293443 [Colletotrichum somersetense]